MTHPGCRIRSVRPKDGSAKIIQLVDNSTRDRIGLLARVRGILDTHGPDLAGFAVVIWDTNMGSTAFVQATERSPIPSVAMPAFLSNRLLASKIDEWSNQ